MTDRRISLRLQGVCALVLVFLQGACEGIEGDVISARSGGMTGPIVASAGADCPVVARGITVLDNEGRLSRVSVPVGIGSDVIVSASSGVVPNCVGRALCLAPGSGALAVDRRGYVWMGCRGEIFRVDPNTGQCELVGAGPGRAGFSRFTMTFLRERDAAPEILFVAGTDLPMGATGGPMGPAADALRMSGALPGVTSTLATLRLPDDAPEKIGTLSGWPGLAVTVDQQLWGYFPPGPQGPPRVAVLDPRTGQVQRSLVVPPPAWASDSTEFVASGAEFLMFLGRASNEAMTVVHRIARADGSSLGSFLLLRRRVVAAASSTCAGP